MEILERILTAYNKNVSIETKSALWIWCESHQKTVDLNEANLENMANTNLIWGFFGGTVSTDNHETVVKLAQALGVCGIQNPENGPQLFPRVNVQGLTTDRILDLIQTKLPFTIDLPKFVGGREILRTERGIITDRHCHYLWIMKRIIELCPDRNSRIVEIGAGLGVLGYYLSKAGYRDYTTFDLAHANACQAYFLSKNLPEREIICSDERGLLNGDTTSLKLLHSTDFIHGLKYDLMINIDGLTEMLPNDAFKYFISDCAPLLLSINHEVNDFRVCDLDKLELHRKRLYRYPFWLREGYVEELYHTV